VPRLVPSTNGVTVALHDLGGSGEPLLIGHANGLCGRAYEPLAAELAPHRHVWALDFRGHGESTPPEGERFDWAGVGDDVLAVVEEIGAPVEGLGHSMGGAALVLAERRQPGTVTSLYLYEPIILPTEVERTPGANPLAEAARKRRDTFDSRADALASYASKALGALRADALAAYVEHGFEDLPDGRVRLRCRPEHEARMFEAAGSITVADASEVSVPTTVAVGATAEEWSPAAFAPAVAEALPHGRLSRHPLLGHFGPLEHPPEIAAEVISSRGGPGSGAGTG
jgi:pimeloyl-ACP methyl ester carboxylesterase